MSTDKAKDTKEKRSQFMADEVRTQLMTQLEKLGVKTENLSDEEIVLKLSKITEEESEKVAKMKAANAVTPLNNYASSPNCKLKDKEFIERLYNMSVPHIYLFTFEDEDKKLDDRAIWQKVRMSGVTQYSDVKEVFSDRSKRIVYG